MKLKRFFCSILSVVVLILFGCSCSTVTVKRSDSNSNSDEFSATDYDSDNYVSIPVESSEENSYQNEESESTFTVSTSESDVDSLDYSNFGFDQRLEYNEWVNIVAYDFSNGTVTIDNNGDYGLDFKSDYYSTFYIRYYNGELKRLDGEVYEYQYKNNDIINYLLYGDLCSFIITDRAVSKKYNTVIIKTQKNGRERWYVPFMSLDWSRGGIETDETLTYNYFDMYLVE